MVRPTKLYQKTETFLTNKKFAETYRLWLKRRSRSCQTALVHVNSRRRYCWRKCNLCVDCSKVRVFWWRHAAGAGSQSVCCIWFLRDGRRSKRTVIMDRHCTYSLAAKISLQGDPEMSWALKLPCTYRAFELNYGWNRTSRLACCRHLTVFKKKWRNWNFKTDKATKITRVWDVENLKTQNVIKSVSQSSLLQETYVHRK